MERKGRIIYLDLLRVTAVFFVMMIHVSASQLDAVAVGSADWHFFNIYDSLARFSVPVFVMISGVFFLDPQREYPLEKLLKKNVLRLVTAYLFWAAAYAFLDALLKYRSFCADFWKELIADTFAGNYHLWFVYMMIGMYLLVPLLRKIAEDERLAGYFIALSFVFCYIGNLLTLLPVIGSGIEGVLQDMNLVTVGGYTGYFMAGYYFYHIGVSKKTKNIVYTLGICSLLFTILGTAALSIHSGTFCNVLYKYLLPNTCLTSWAVFLFFQEIVSKIRFSERTVRWIGKMSELSFGMYLVHIFINSVCKKAGFTTTLFPAALSVPVITAVVFAVSFAVIWIFSKIPFARKYLI